MFEIYVGRLMERLDIPIHNICMLYGNINKIPIRLVESR